MKRVIISDMADIYEISRFCEENGYGVNINRLKVPDYLDISSNAIDNHLEVYKNVDICSIHGPMNDLNCGSKDALIKDITLKRFEFAYEISQSLKCKNIILHNGFVPGTGVSKIWEERAVVFWNDFLFNKNNETVFFIENLLEQDPEIILNIIKNVDNGCLKVCFDVGHANIFSRVKIVEWIVKMNENIGFVHMHNNYGINDEHNGLDNGNIDMNEICKALEEFCPDAIWDLETKEYKRSIEWLKQNKYIKS